MGRLASAYGQAINSHRAARAHLDAARNALGAAPAAVAPVGVDALVTRLARLGGALATPAPGATPLTDEPAAVRIGEASISDGGFPVLVPLGGGHHLALDTDARDPRVAGLLRALVLRLVATAPPGQVRVAGIDTAALGATFGPLRPLLDAGVLDPPATSEAEVAALLDAAEQHARAAQHGRPAGRHLLVVVATAAPPPRELARLAALTHAGPAAAVCVLLTGHPSRVPGETAPPLGGTTAIRLHQGYAQVGDPPGIPFSADGSGLAAPVVLDSDPPAASVRALAEHLGAATRRADALPFTDLLPERRWAESAGNGLRTVIGRAGTAPLTLAFDDATPHWLVGGAPARARPSSSSTSSTGWPPATPRRSCSSTCSTSRRA